MGLALLPWWDKADDLALAHITLARIHLAQANREGAKEAIESAIQIIQTRGVFSEARKAVEVAQVRLWLAQGDLQAVQRWAADQEECLHSDDLSGFEHELTHITRARVFIALNKPNEAINLLSQLEETARSAGRMGRVIEILLLEALARQKTRDSERAMLALTTCLTLTHPAGYVRVFLDEGQPMQQSLAQWLTYAGSSPLRDYAMRLLAQFDATPHMLKADQVDSLSERELDVLRLMAEGLSNRQIASHLILSELDFAQSSRITKSICQAG